MLMSKQMQFPKIKTFDFVMVILLFSIYFKHKYIVIAKTYI